MARNTDILNQLNYLGDSLLNNMGSLIAVPLNDIAKSMDNSYKNLSDRLKDLQSNNQEKILNDILEGQQQQTQEILQGFEENLNENINELVKVNSNSVKSNSQLIKELNNNSTKSVQIIGENIETGLVSMFDNFKESNLITRDSLELQRQSFENFQKQLIASGNNDNKLIQQILDIDSKSLDFSLESQNSMTEIFNAIKSDLNSEKMNTTLVNISSSLEMMNLLEQKKIAKEAERDRQNELRSKEYEKESKQRAKNEKDSNLVSNLLNTVGSLFGLGGLGTLFPMMTGAISSIYGFAKNLPSLTANLFTKLSSLTAETLSVLGKGGGVIKDIAMKGAGLIKSSFDLIKSFGSKAISSVGKVGAKALAGGAFVGTALYDMGEGFNQTEKIMGKEGKEFGTADIVNAGGVNALTMGGLLADPSKVQQKIEAGFDYFMQPNLPSSATNNPEADKLASVAMNRNVTKTKNGITVQRGNVNIVEAAGACYENVWGDIQNAGLSGKIAPVGGKHKQNYATDFAEWADSKGRGVLDKVGYNPNDKKTLGLQAGDIIVMKAGWHPKNYAGHIEIVGKDYSGYSDFKDSNLKIVRNNPQSIQGIYRLKNNSSFIAKKKTKTVIKNAPLTKKAIDYKKQGLTEHESGGNFSKAIQDKSFDLGSIEENEEALINEIVPNISLPDSAINATVKEISDKTKMSDILNKIPDSSNLINTKFNEMSSNVPNFIMNKISELNLGEEINNILSQLPSITNTMSRLIDNYIPKDLLPTIDKLGNLLPEDIKQGMSSFSESIVTSTQSFFNNLPEPIKNILPQSLSQGFESLISLPQMFSDLSTNPLSFLDKGINLATDLFLQKPKESEVDLKNMENRISANSITGRNSRAGSINTEDVTAVNTVTAISSEILKQAPYLKQENNNAVPAPTVMLNSNSNNTPKVIKSYNIDDIHLAIVTSGVFD